MTKVPLGVGAYKRSYAGAPEIRLLNRFFEASPSNQIDGVSLLARPCSTRLSAFGQGPIRANFSQPGAFSNDLFTVSDTALYRYTEEGTTQLIGGEVLGSGEPSMAVVAGAGYEHLFIADGLLLQVYTGGTHASGTLTDGGGTITNLSHSIKIGTTYYTWATDVNAGSPNGSQANPWRAAIGGSDDISLDNMRKLINFAGVRGTDYSSTLGGPSGDVTATHPSATTLVVTAISEYADGNSIATTVESGTGFSWGGATLSGGGTHALSGIETPDGVGIVSLASIAQHLIAVQSNSQRIYWIEPGDLTIDPLNFATAESEPDQIVNVLAVGDQFWLIGQSTTEPWYATGDAAAPFAPVQGRAFARGVLDGTAVKVKDDVILTGRDGVVYSVSGGIRRVSNHGIEERIRTQIRREQGLL